MIKKIIMPLLTCVSLTPVIGSTPMIDTTYLPNQLWGRAFTILGNFYPTHEKGNLESLKE